MLVEPQLCQLCTMLIMKVHGNVLLKVFDKREQVSVVEFKVRIQFDGNRRFAESRGQTV